MRLGDGEIRLTLPSPSPEWRQMMEAATHSYPPGVFPALRMTVSVAGAPPVTFMMVGQTDSKMSVGDEMEVTTVWRKVEANQ